MLTWVVRMSWCTPPCSYTFPLVGFSTQLLRTYMPGSLNADGEALFRRVRVRVSVRVRVTLTIFRS